MIHTVAHKHMIAKNQKHVQELLALNSDEISGADSNRVASE